MKTSKNNTTAKTTKVTFVQSVMNAIRKPKTSADVVVLLQKQLSKKTKKTVDQNTRWYLSNLVANKMAKRTKDGLYVCTVK